MDNTANPPLEPDGATSGGATATFGGTAENLPARVAAGELWRLGPHRLLCADAADSTAISRLFAGVRWDVLLTSPPYAQQRSYGLPPFDWTALMTGVTRAALPHAAGRFHALVNLGLVHRQGKVQEYWRGWLVACRRLGLPLYGWYVWDKGHALPGFHHGRLGPAHEFIFHLARDPWPPLKWIGKKHTAVRNHKRGNRQRNGSLRAWCSPQASAQPTKIPDSVIRLPREQARGLHTRHHPAVFPVALPRYLLRSFAPPGSVIYEPFAGSGSTLLAAHELGLTTLACEINPIYCNLILARFEQTTGIAAVREGTS